MENIDIYKDNNPDNDKLLETKKVLDSIYQELYSLKIDTDPNIVSNISNKLEKLEQNSIDYSNLYQREIILLTEILKDYKGETGRELDEKGNIDFQYNYKIFAEYLNQNIEKIRSSDISLIYIDNYLSNINGSNTIREKVESQDKLFNDFMKQIKGIYRDNNNTEIIYIDIHDVSDEYLDAIKNIENKYNKDIRVIFGVNNDLNKEKYKNQGFDYAGTTVDEIKGLIYLKGRVIKTLKKKRYKKYQYKSIIDDIVTTDKDTLHISDIVNLILNPKNLLKFKFGNKELNKDTNKFYYGKDYKGNNNNFTKLSLSNYTKIPDSKIIMIGAIGDKSYLKDNESLDQFIDKHSGELVSGLEVIANSIVDNDLNK